MTIAAQGLAVTLVTVGGLPTTFTTEGGSVVIPVPPAGGGGLIRSAMAGGTQIVSDTSREAFVGDVMVNL